MTCNNDILYKILTKNYDFCCLCLVENKNAIHIQDEVVLKNEAGEKTLKVIEILQPVLGYEMMDTISAFDNICKKCISTAVNSYKFIKTTKENSEIIHNYINSLTLNLESSENYLFDNKSMYITYNTANLTCQNYLDEYKANSKTTAVKTLNSLFNLDTKFNIKKELHLSDKKPIKINYSGNKKRQHYTYTVPTKTSDMLHDKNNPNNLKCKICLKPYPSLSNLRNHFIRVHAPKKYKCSICDRKFGSLALVEAHENESHCTLVCKDCGKTFNNRHTLKMHEIGHYYQVICPDCGRVYKSQSTFKKHKDLNVCGQKNRASPTDAKFTCDYCNKKYTQKVTLRVHIQYEHGNYKSHECKWCKKKFWAQSRLKAHIVKHTQEKNFTCQLCGGKFVSKESLLYHTRTHTGEKPYKCEFCDLSFLSTSRRADHRKRHHSNAVLQCKLCTVKFTTQSGLQRHMKTHDSQPFDNLNDLRLSDDEFFLEEEEDRF